MPHCIPLKNPVCHAASPSLPVPAGCSSTPGTRSWQMCPAGTPTCAAARRCISPGAGGTQWPRCRPASPCRTGGRSCRTAPSPHALCRKLGSTEHWRSFLLPHAAYLQGLTFRRCVPVWPQRACSMPHVPALRPKHWISFQAKHIADRVTSLVESALCNTHQQLWDGASAIVKSRKCKPSNGVWFHTVATR